MTKHSKIFKKILQSRGLQTTEKIDSFLRPDYEMHSHDPFLLPDMDKAVDRLQAAKKKQQKIIIYGDYDIDGLTATALLLDAFKSFGFENVDSFIPNRFIEGYGLTIDAMQKLVDMKADLIITVDCGSLSTAEIEYAKDKGVDVIVTDHHNVQLVQPPAIAVINPKRLLQDNPDEYDNYSAVKQDSALYPFIDLPGVGVAFKLVQAMQQKMDGLAEGQEKWLLDLVALGTVCDVVTLKDENRMHVYWGLKVLAKTRRPGLKALMAVSKVEPNLVNARSLGFALGPRMNAAGRLETAQVALDLLTTADSQLALERAYVLDDLNAKRRKEQDKIYKDALRKAEDMKGDSVLVVSSSGWNHGIVGIVAAKLLEKFKKPVFVLEEMGEETKGSARSYGDFSAADSIRFSDDIITKGGGHRLAAGVTLPTANISKFRKRVNEFYKSQKLVLNEEQIKLLPRSEADISFSEVGEDLVNEIALLEPFGNGNEQPILRSGDVLVTHVRKMGNEDQHVKLTVEAKDGTTLQLLSFNAPEHFFVETGSRVSVWFRPDINEWQGRRSVEGVLLHLEVKTG